MVLDWLVARYPDLLAPDEHHFIATFSSLPRPARALLVRMVMRRGELFRASKLNYPEIGPTTRACSALIDTGWVQAQPALNLEQIFALYTKPEIASLFALPAALAKARKEQQLQALAEKYPGLSANPANWFGAENAAHDPVYQLQIMPLCERLRLMFFGNLHQDWTEFVLSDLGIFQFEKVDLAADARGFQSRADIEHYLTLFHIREQWQQGESIEATLSAL
ncbi:MAG: Fanconi-associated nuclease, partial [Pseudomonadota bacterium]